HVHADEAVDHPPLTSPYISHFNRCRHSAAAEIAVMTNKVGTFALWITFFVGRQAMFGHDPPMRRRSTTAVRRPSLALVQAMSLPPVPLPKTRTSKCSISLITHVSSSSFCIRKVSSWLALFSRG